MSISLPTMLQSIGRRNKQRTAQRPRDCMAQWLKHWIHDQKLRVCLPGGSLPFNVSRQVVHTHIMPSCH